MSKLLKNLVELNGAEIGNNNLVNIKLDEDNLGGSGYVRAKIGSLVWKKFVEDNFVEETLQHSDLYSFKHNLNREIRAANDRAIKIVGVGEKHLRALQFITGIYDDVGEDDYVKLKIAGGLQILADIDSMTVLTSREYEVFIHFLDDDANENVFVFDDVEVVKTIKTDFKINSYEGEYDPTIKQWAFGWAFGCADITARQVEIFTNMFTEMDNRKTDNASCDIEYVQLGRGSFKQWHFEEMFAIQEGNQ